MVEALFKLMLKIPISLEITFVSLIFGFLIGVAVALIRIYRVKILCRPADFYVSVIRGTPMLLHVYTVYLGIPLMFDALAKYAGWSARSKDIPTIAFIFIALSVNSGAYMSETVRSGILAVQKGEIEAGYSVGMTTMQVLRRIVLPQALVVCLPNLCNSIVSLLHGSALASFIGVSEITNTANMLAGDNWKFFESFVAAAILYWGCAIVIEQIMGYLERKMARRCGAPGVPASSAA
jgi:L-cystine transport system permease protein